MKRLWNPEKMTCLSLCRKLIQTMASSNNFENIVYLFIVNVDELSCI